MANFIALVDADGDRRRRFVQAVRAEIALMDSLEVDSIEAGDLSVVWAAQDRAPVSTMRSSSTAAVIWGDAIPGPGPERLDAERLFREWAPRGNEAQSAYDGFYAALRYDKGEGLTVGADLLGLFPVYYARNGDTMVVGSSPELFRRHPGFPAKLSLEALTGLLLMHAPVEGRALLSGVQRLGAGNVVTWRAGRPPLEIVHYEIPMPSGDDDGSFDDHMALLDSVTAGAVNRHVPSNDSVGLLLSGGTDTRQLAGYLREHGNPVHAITFGDASDYEMMCAKAVARCLDVPHLVKALVHSELPGNARQQAKWEHLGSGFSSPHMWGAAAPLRELPSRVVSGYLWGIRNVDPLPTSFDELINGSKLHGIPAPTLRRLLRPDLFEGLVESLERRMRDAFDAGCKVDRTHPSRFVLAHNLRIHAGGVPWKLSFGSWPVLPILDRAVLNAVFTLPDETLRDRRAHHEIIRRRFPDLACLPLDRNTHDTLPLLPSRGKRVRHRVGEVLEPIRRHIPRRIERRYYHRIYDINNPGWRAVRRMAEPHRERLEDLFEMDVLRELVPSPDTHIAVENKVRDSFGTKQLLGLMLWSADHLA
jgi:asparagine synthase (glutamine-hydrolysing)